MQGISTRWFYLGNLFLFHPTLDGLSSCCFCMGRGIPQTPYHPNGYLDYTEAVSLKNVHSGIKSLAGLQILAFFVAKITSFP